MKPLNTLRFWKKSVVKKILREFEKNEKGERQLEGKRRLLKEVVYITSSFITEYIYISKGISLLICLLMLLYKWKDSICNEL